MKARQPTPAAASEAEARLRKATRIANYLQVTVAEDLLAAGLEEGGGVLLSLGDDWWRNVCFHAGTRWRKAPSAETRALVVSLLRARLDPGEDPFAPAPEDVDFRGCAEAGQ